MKSRYLISWTIVVLTLPLLAVLAWNQFNWLEELRKRETFRIETAMIESVRELSKGLREELLFLPSLLRFRQEESVPFEDSFAERWRFWRFYAVEPGIISHVYLSSAASPDSPDSPDSASSAAYAEWTGSAFERTEEPPEARVGGRIGETEGALIISIGYFAERGTRRSMICVFDKEAIFSKLIPSIAAQTLTATGDFAYRIVSTETGRTLWTSLPDGEEAGESAHREGDSLFAHPDLEMSITGSIEVPLFQQTPGFSTTSLIDITRGSFSFIKERSKIDPGTPPDQIPGQVFSHLKLQIANRDGSLKELSRKSTIQNATVSFGIVILLACAMILLAQTGQKSKRLAESQKEFIATITHELKTPLAVISSAAQNLSDGLVRDRQKAEQYGAMIRKEASRLGISIEHFLLYSNTGSINRMKPETVSVEELVQAALRFTEEERLNNEFRTEVSLPDEPLFVQGDRVALESVFQNLAQNVLRHAREGKYLGIIVSYQGDSRKNRAGRIILKIRDKGPGIPARELKTVFEPFVRGKRAMDKQIPGNGIGLNLVKRIVAMHGGTISAESKAGNGCVFTVSLPAAEGVHDA